MRLWRTAKDWSLLFHAFLFSMPCVVLGVLGSLIMLWAELHGSEKSLQEFLVVGAVWMLLSALVPACVIVVFALWVKAGPAGPRGGLRLLEALVVLSAVQGIPAQVMIGTFRSEPFFVVLAVLFGAPWLTLACHMRWKAARALSG